VFNRVFSRGEFAPFLVFAIFAAAIGVNAQTETVLHSFSNNGEDGFQSYAGLTLGQGGKLYGTTYSGGAYGLGSVFELTPQANGSWLEIILHSFAPMNDGQQPTAGVIFDSSGNLYGTTTYGGRIIGSLRQSYSGTVFELIPQADGTWSENVIHSFLRSGADGDAPVGGLVFDSMGNLYGTTEGGGAYGEGTAFQLSPQADGGWGYKVLHSFGASSTDGINPTAGLAVDSAGNLYGTTIQGGTNYCSIGDGSCGTVFQLSRQAGGRWEETLLHSFNDDGMDGILPVGGLTLVLGHLYGTTNQGGVYNAGTVYELSPSQGGAWAETLLHSFNDTDGDGYYPGYVTPVLDGAGNVYGTANEGGAHQCGIVFRLSAGTWEETVLHSFDNNGVDGQSPAAGVVLDAAKNIFGTTEYGGLNDVGTVFEIVP